VADRLYTSSEADEIFSALRFETKVEKATLARMAFALSVAKVGKDVPHSPNFSGGEMKRPTFFADDEAFIRAVLSYTYKKPDLSEDELFSNRALTKNHIDYGASILSELFQSCGRSGDGLISALLKEVEFSGRRENFGRGLDVFIGRTLLRRDELVMELNNTSKHANSHLAIMGKPGVGKTQFLLKLLADIRVQSNFQTNFVYFDYKGDVVDNEKFLKVAKAQPYRLLQAGQSLPINPFVLPSYDDQSINISAREKAESFASINSKLGVVQKGALTEAIRAGYAKRSGSSAPYPDFQDILEIAVSSYDDNSKKDDSLIEVLRDLSDFDLFWKHGNESAPIEKVSNRTLLIDVHAMPVLKELVAYLVIERLYKEMSIMSDSPVIDGKRTIRSILVIDEAHNYLSQKNIFLQRIIREGRSKGVVVFFLASLQTTINKSFSISRSFLNLPTSFSARV
jgi:DNA sulfur modification protein DndE